MEKYRQTLVKCRGAKGMLNQYLVRPVLLWKEPSSFDSVRLTNNFNRHTSNSNGIYFQFTQIVELVEAELYFLWFC
jgi:hypothetical protein